MDPTLPSAIGGGLKVGKQSKYWDLPVKCRVAIAVSFTAGAELGVSAFLQFDWTQYWEFLAILTVATVTANTKVRLLGGSSLSLLTSLVLMAVVSLGMEAAVMIGVIGVVLQTAVPARTVVSYNLVFNVGMIAVTMWGAGLAYELSNFGGASGALVGLMAASFIYYLGNSVFVSMIVALSSGQRAFKVWHDHFLYTAPAFFIAEILTFAAYEILRTVHFGVLLVLTPILYMSCSSYRVYLENLEKEKAHAEEMAKLYKSTLETLVLAIDAKDQNQGHVVRVEKYARALAVSIGLGDEEVEGLAAAALLHDIGKLAVPEYILRKEGALTVEEMDKMKLHCNTGTDIIANINFSYPVEDAIRYHHERFDGSGYPEGLKGAEISFGARLLAVVDSCEGFMARHGHLTVSADAAIDMLRRDSGVLFDPEIVEAWSEIYQEVTAEFEVKDDGSEVATPYTEIERAASEVNSLDSLSESIRSMESVREIAVTATRMLQEKVQPCTAVFWLLRQDELVSCSESPEDTVMMPLGAGVAGWVAAEQSPCVNIKGNFGSYQGSRIVAVPVVFDGETVGVLSLYRGNPEFSADELRLVNATADRIAATINKVSTLEAAIQHATSDRLTGLANRRALEETFEKLDGHPFSIVLFDINAFKAVNDTFGHHAGDDALVRIAEHLQSRFESYEVVCQLGGDEFLVATPDSTFNTRRKIRDFRKLVAQDVDFQRYLEFGFGVSWGVACSPDDGASLNDVTAIADKRMYNFKIRMKKADRVSLPAAR